MQRLAIKDWYNKFKRNRKAISPYDMDELISGINTYKGALYSDIWDSWSVLHEPRYCSYFPSYNILKRVVYQYIQLLQTYSSLASSILDSFLYYKDKYGKREYEHLSELYMYCSLLEGTFSAIEFGINNANRHSDVDM